MSNEWWDLPSFIDAKRKELHLDQVPNETQYEKQEKNFCSINRWFYNIQKPSKLVPICSKCELDNNLWRKLKDNERKDLLYQIGKKDEKKRWNCTKWCFQWDFHHNNRLNLLEKETKVC